MSETIGRAIGSFIVMAFTLSLKLVITVLYSTLVTMRWVGTNGLKAFGENPKSADLPQAKKELEAKTTQVVAAPVQETTTAVATATPPEHSPFKVADRIVTVNLQPAVGVIRLKVYESAMKVHAEMVITDEAMRKLMKGRTHSLLEMTFDPAKGLDGVKAAALAEGTRLMKSATPQVKTTVTPTKTKTRPAPQKRAVAVLQPWE